MGGQLLTYRVGLNVYPTLTGGREVWAYSEDFKVLIPDKQSPNAKFTFPYEFNRGELPEISNSDY